jgi:acetyl-CoA C-acetyltransferase/acetyl-CoA acyltransferase
VPVAVPIYNTDRFVGSETMPRPVIAAVGTSRLGRTDLPGRDLFSQALAEAFDGLPAPAELVGALYAGNQSERYENQIMHGTLLAEWAGLRHVPAERVEGCAAAGALALRHAVKDVRNGEHEAVLACGVEKMTAGGTAGATESLAAAFDRAIEQRSGVTAPSQYAMLARRYLHETDATERDLARIAVKNHRNAARNPRAQFGDEIDVDTVLGSQPVAPPLKLYDCAPIGDGAAVVLVTTAETAADLGVPAVELAGTGAAANNIAVAERDMTHIEGARIAAERAYAEAGIEAADVDVAEVHDAFTVSEALLSEAAGFAPEGKGHQSHLPPAERDDGWTDVALSTSGGLKARGHPIGATGILQAVEAYEQLTGVAADRPGGTGGPPDGPAADPPETAFLLNEGGVADAVTVAHVLTAAPEVGR